jgi:hypothetical protein
MIEQNEMNEEFGESKLETEEQSDSGTRACTDSTPRLLRSLHMELQQQRNDMTAQHAKIEKRHDSMEMRFEIMEKRLDNIRSSMYRIEKMLASSIAQPNELFSVNKDAPEIPVSSDGNTAYAPPKHNVRDAERRKRPIDPAQEKALNAELCFPTWLDPNSSGSFPSCGPEMTGWR